jgi:hypothetical protein
LPFGIKPFFITSKGERMAHPSGGSGNKFDTLHSFSEAYNFVGAQGIEFPSTTHQQVTARQGMTRDKITSTIVFEGHGSVCNACWGFRLNCSGTRIGHCAEALDDFIASGAVESPNKVPPHNPRNTNKIIAPDNHLDEMVNADDLARWRRGLLRILDALDAHSISGEGPVAKINRLSREARIPREIASCMRLVAEMRNVTEYEGKRLSPHEKAAAKNSWLSVEAWARENNITFEL